MATVTLRSGTATSNVSPFTSGSFTPANNDLLVVGAVASGTVASLPAVSNTTGVTFSVAVKTLKKVSADSLILFVADGLTTNVSQTCTLSFAADASTGQILFVASITGVTRIGPDAIRQTAATANAAAGGTPAATFPGVALTGNVIIGMVGNSTSPATVTPPTSFTETATIGDLGYSTPTTGGEFVFRNSGHTSATVTWGSTSASAFGVVLAEIDTSALTPGTPFPRQLHQARYE